MTQIKGKLKVKFDTVVVSDKFQKREFVIDTGGEYPQDILFQLQQNNCDKLDKFNVGDEVDVSYNPRGNQEDGQTLKAKQSTSTPWSAGK